VFVESQVCCDVTKAERALFPYLIAEAHSHGGVAAGESAIGGEDDLVINADLVVLQSEPAKTASANLLCYIRHLGTYQRREVGIAVCRRRAPSSGFLRDSGGGVNRTPGNQRQKKESS
jgi:hypothetical protein